MLLLWLCCLAQGSQVQAATLTEKQLSERLAQYRSISRLEATFKQTKTIKDLDVQIKSEGRFVLEKGGKVQWEILKPSHVVISMNHEVVKIQTDGENGKEIQTQTVHFNDLPSKKVAQSLSGLMVWLNLDSHELASKYDVSKEKNEFRFTPREKKSFDPFQNLLMALDAHGHVKEVKILENSGDFIDIEFGNPKITPK